MVAMEMKPSGIPPFRKKKCIFSTNLSRAVLTRVLGAEGGQVAQPMRAGQEGVAGADHNNFQFCLLELKLKQIKKIKKIRK